MDRLRLRTLWGATSAVLDIQRRVSGVDLLLVLGVVGIVFGAIDLAHEWTGPHRPHVVISLSPWALPGYTLFSLARGLMAYLLSLAFTLVYGYWAAKDRIAGAVLIPLLDILQSIPVLGFMPGLVLVLVRAFPASNIGLELAAVIMIFTAQAWNMTFSFYHSLRSVPSDQREAATIYRFSAWQRLKWVELPFATIGLVWNSMMSMAGGWFFLMINEAFKLGDADYRLPGVGSYMSEAVDKNDPAAMVYAVLAMTLMIVGLDQLLWRPVVVWAQKFRVEESGQQQACTSWFLDLLRRSRVLSALGSAWGRLVARREDRPRERPAPRAAAADSPWAQWLSRFAFALLLFLMVYGGWRLLTLLWGVPISDWGRVFGGAGLTLSRVLISTAIGTLWALPAGLAIGLSPRLSNLLQPVVQVVASFPAPMLFPIVIAVLHAAGVSLDFGSVALMLLGTQWYILFNVIAGAMAIPADLREAARSYRIRGWQRFWILYFPAVFPALVTGWVTAAGGAWNASIVAEYVTFKGEVLQAHGLGAEISRAAAGANFPLLAASVLVMSLIVVAFNRTVWRRLYRLAEERFSL